MSRLFILFFAWILFLSQECPGQNGNEIISYDTSVKLDRNQLTVEKSFVIQINNKDSDWIGDISINCSAGDKLEIQEASIFNLQGEELRKLKKKDIERSSYISNGTFFSDEFVESFELKWYQYPYIIKYSYKLVTDKYISLAHWYPIENLKTYVHKASLKLLVPGSTSLRYEGSDRISFNKSSGTREDIYVWNIEDYSPGKPELFSPPIMELIPHVIVYPDEFNYGIPGRLTSWTDFGKWQAGLNEGTDDLTFSEKNQVDKLISGLTDKKEIIKTLYYYLQDNTRYINVDIDIGGLKTYPASYVCTNKYGDCKALSNYMKSLLNYAGIRSCYTKVYAGDNPVRLNENIPGQQFNHVILAVPLETDTIWLENTSDYLPYNFLGTFTQNRNALIVDGENSKLVKTPALKLQDVFEDNFYQVELDSLGNGLFSGERKMGGEAVAKYSRIRTEWSEKDQFELIEDEIPLQEAKVHNWSLIEKNRDEPKGEIHLNGNVKNQFRFIGNSIVLKHSEFAMPDFEKPSDRKTPVRINYPINKRDSLVYTLTSMKGYSFQIPENIERVSRFGKYVETYKLNDQGVLIDKHFQLFKGDYSLDEYESFYNFINDIKETQQQTVVYFNPL